MKRTKKLLAILPLLFMMAGCGGKNSSGDTKTTDTTVITTNNEEDKVDVRYQIYLSAVNAGLYDGNYEGWLESIKGDSIQLKVENNYVVFKYKQENEWTNLLSLDALKGDTGATGKNSKLQVKDGYIQWQNDGDTTWNNLIKLDDLKGVDGNSKKNDMRVSNGYIQWKYEDATVWNDLLDLSTLMGEAGKNASMRVSGGNIQWQNEGDGENWNNLIAVSDLNGSDGREIELIEEGGVVKWRYTGDNGWTNLYTIDQTTQTFEVYFDYDGGDGVIPTIDQEYFDSIGFRGDVVEFGHKVRKPFDPYKAGYEFDGWYYGDEKWLFSVYVVTEEMTLKAKFTEIKEPYSDIDKFDYTIEDGKYVIAGLKTQYLDGDFDMLVLPKNIKSMDSHFYSGNISTLIYNGTLEDWCEIEIKEYDAGLICCSNTFYYQDDNGLINFGGLNYKTIDRYFTIPSEISKIGDYQFYGAKINSVTIPNTVTEIGRNPFAACMDLTTISVDSYNTIYDSRDANAIFESATDTIITGCKNTDLSGSVVIKAIGDYAFADGNLEGENGHLVLPEGIETIGFVSFGGCKKLKSVRMPQSLKEIGDFAFIQCENLESVSLNDLFDIDDTTVGLRRIGQWAFANCYSLANIHIPASVSEMGDYVFQSCYGLTTVYFMSQRLITIPEYTFYDCKNLNTIVLELNITKIGEAAFQRNNDHAPRITLFFSGASQSDFQAMDISNIGNYDFENAKVYYFSYYKPNPFVADTYWHYNSQVLAEIWQEGDPEQD